MFLQLFLSFRGRVSPQVYLLATVGAFAAANLLSALVVAAGLPTVIAMMAGAFQNVASLSLGVKRLHDSGRSGAWVIAGIGVLLAASMVVMQNAMSANKIDPTNEKAIEAFLQNREILQSIAIPIMAVCVVLTLIFYLLPRNPDANQYGPRPPG
jgi:uncharacterized membrane protein YhaH (DUF805 family)